MIKGKLKNNSYNKQKDTIKVSFYLQKKPHNLFCWDQNNPSN